ncbi:hypothetical protein DM01DRAFT_1332275 [Hesseltinella vesiculosa]|uniref:Alpha/gamma-adaptin-binding protein p34 n=1 Tax=Hesseltinella vesiculosa TaxID=101127 RepID=A0A1X2GUJ3_9FUNG|nr:hypothetical protein DM01DRAFT_1332275 [Hesseltinella vesiculosa]
MQQPRSTSSTGSISGPRNVILVTGDSTQDLTHVVECLKDICNKANDGSFCAKDALYNWKISNKYYTANVEFQLLEATAASRLSVIQAHRNNHSLCNRVDAFIYVFQKEQPTSFDGLKDWLAYLNDQAPAIKLCVGLPSANQLDEDVNAWCVAQEIEYVDMDAEAEDKYDKVGHELILESLQAHMWEGIDMKLDLENTSRLPLDFDDAELDLDDQDSDLGLPDSEAVQQMQEKLFGTIDEDDGLDMALKSLERMRLQGMSLPDDERRRMAAEVALSFAAQLGLDDDDDH